MRTWVLLTSMLVTQQGGEVGFRSVADVTELMTALIIPASNVVGNVGLDGEPDEAAWAEIERQAIVLAESGNLLLMPSRAQGRELWIEASKDLIEAGVAALEASRQRDTDKLMLDVSEAVFASCTACHDEYFN